MADAWAPSKGCKKITSGEYEWFKITGRGGFGGNMPQTDEECEGLCRFLSCPARLAPGTHTIIIATPTQQQAAPGWRSTATETVST